MSTREEQFAQYQSESSACLEIYEEWKSERFGSACARLASHVRQQAQISANAEHAILLLEQAVKQKNAALKLFEEEQDRAVHLRGLLEAPHADTALADERAIEIALLKQSSVKLSEELADANAATDHAIGNLARADAQTIKTQEELRLLKSDHALMAKNYAHVGKSYDESVQEVARLRAEVAQLQKNCTDIYDAGRKTEERISAELAEAQERVRKIIGIDGAEDGEGLVTYLIRRKAERDQLRAEVERLTKDQKMFVEANYSQAYLLQRIAAAFGTDADDELPRVAASFRTRAERAEAELAKERARLNWLNTIQGADWFGHCDYGESTRAAIDAAMND